MRRVTWFFQWLEKEIRDFPILGKSRDPSAKGLGMTERPTPSASICVIRWLTLSSSSLAPFAPWRENLLHRGAKGG